MKSRVWRLVLAALCLLALFSTVQAATQKKPAAKEPEIPAMTFYVVRSSVTGCEPNCPQWIAAEGQIMQSSASQFRKFLKKVGKLKLPVIITSPGGDVTSALAIGEMIRERKLDVAVGWTLYSDCSPLAKSCKLPKSQKGVYRGLAMTGRGYCTSACPFILAAGQKRVADISTYVGVHEISVQPITQRIRYYETYRIVNGKKKVVSRKVVSRKNIVGKVTTKLSKPFNRRLKSYLEKMGVDIAMLDLLYKAPPSSIYQLTTQEMKTVNLVTFFSPADSLVAPVLCGTKPAENCVLEKIPRPITEETALRQTARKLTGGPMTFTLVRSNGPGCEPNCPEWIFADGIITRDSPALLGKVFNRIGDRKLPVVIRSDGGDANAAMAMGRMVRHRNATVAVGATHFDGCAAEAPNCRSKPDRNRRSRGMLVSDKVYCNGACPLVLASGTVRLAGQDSMIGVEMFEAAGDKAQVLKVSTGAQAGGGSPSNLDTYLSDMGLTKYLPYYMSKALPRDLYYLSFSEGMSTRLLTSSNPTHQLSNPQLCKESPPADHCVRR